MWKIVVGASIALSSGFKGKLGLQDNTTKPKRNITRLNSMQREGILLPILRARVAEALQPAEEGRRTVLAIHDPGEVTAQGYGQGGRHDQDQHRQEPDLKLIEHRGQTFRV